MEEGGGGRGKSQEDSSGCLADERCQTIRNSWKQQADYVYVEKHIVYQDYNIRAIQKRKQFMKMTHSFVKFQRYRNEVYWAQNKLIFSWLRGIMDNPPTWIFILMFSTARCQLVDIVFIVDSSGSVGESSFNKTLQFVETLVQRFIIGPGSIQVGMVTFGTEPHLQFHLNKYNNKNDIVNAILTTNYTGGYTYTNLALSYVKGTSLAVANGARPNAAKIAIIITDGKSGNSTATNMEAQNLRNQGVTVFSVGVGSGANTAELEAMATYPDCQHVFSVINFDNLTLITANLLQKISEVCQDGYYGFNCSESCSPHCADTCDRNIGRCTCIPGWTGATCDKECPDGTHGPYCLSLCSVGCERGTCNKDRGNCSCEPGYIGDYCNQTCIGGTYGVDCSSSCSSGCSNTCTGDHGTCTCKPGWKGEKCDIECPNGTHGVNCDRSCSLGCEEGVCHRETGHCMCQPGWQGEDCRRECDNGTYGANCQNTCSVGCAKNSCRRTDGTCSCVSGYEGSKCADKSNSVSVCVGVGSGFVVIIIVTIAVVLIILFVQKRKIIRKRKDYILKKTTSIQNVLSMKRNRPSTSAHSNDEHIYEEDILGQKEFENDTSGKTKSDYANICYSSEENLDKSETPNTSCILEKKVEHRHARLLNDQKKAKKRVVFNIDVKEELYENSSSFKQTTGMADYENI